MLDCKEVWLACWTVALVTGRGRLLLVNISFVIAEKNDLGGGVRRGQGRLRPHGRGDGHELRPHGVAAVSLHPGFVWTEGAMKHASFLRSSW
ncbi:uncharacterized protein SOCE26_102140 [Sorangium cellulosum]|uniref:Uncharacterized protein n=1 Tax=Sorangium cellulosum TaxID=56 RepID=A0A2L0FAW2_SORCE|nr:hypothetical protein [Sorangium cellulosum]AUX48673.1 uncharacterized protein SOCE26_102140 [Sorangium cellulosum]